jgi:hypothetical protein
MLTTNPKIDGTPNEVRIPLLPNSCWKPWKPWKQTPFSVILGDCTSMQRNEAADRLAGRQNKGHDPPEQTITYDVM